MAASDVKNTRTEPSPPCLAEVANQRVHGTTQGQVMARWGADHAAMHPINTRPQCPYMDYEQRKVARDAFASSKGSGYSVPWSYAGKEVWVRDHSPSIEIRFSAERIAVHTPAQPGCKTVARTICLVSPPTR